MNRNLNTLLNKKSTKNLGERSTLTGKHIDKLSVYYVARLINSSNSMHQQLHTKLCGGNACTNNHFCNLDLLSFFPKKYPRVYLFGSGLSP